jgi:hypothetical protein
MEDAVEASKLFEVLMGDEVEPRRQPPKRRAAKAARSHVSLLEPGPARPKLPLTSAARSYGPIRSGGSGMCGGILISKHLGGQVGGGVVSLVAKSLMILFMLSVAIHIATMVSWVATICARSESSPLCVA